MEILTTHILDWLILLSLLGVALYALRVIGQEKSSFKQDSYEVQFGDLSLTIPNWWTLTEQAPTCLKFERTDTRYDWYAIFTYFPDRAGKELPLILEEKLNQEELEFDKDVVFETDSRVLFRDDKIQEAFQEIIRVEGQATQKIEDRVYYDIYLMRRLSDEGYFIFESKSSVLNGLVEGPYFEESLSELSFIRES
jgi:hypothetical protein